MTWQTKWKALSLTVRSFSGWFMRIGTEARVNVCREVQECEDALVQAREGREMTAPAAAVPDDGQRQPLKGLQQAFSRWMSRGSPGIADVQPGQRGLGRSQAPTHAKLDLQEGSCDTT